MLEFNNNHIFTGYLKQLLSSFNLPTCKIYSMDQYNYNLNNNKEIDVFTSLHDDTTKRYIPYIKDNLFQEYIDNEWVPLNTEYEYYYGKRNLHYTKNLIIKDNIYDSYTHEYLGNYLRFQRDYNNIDLMPLYNCFNNKICSNVDISFNIKTKNSTKEIVFDGTDPAYKIYMVPVKFFKNYTIAIDSELPVEFCCWFYNKYQRKITTSTETTTADVQFLKNTYFRTSSAKFSQPFLFSKLYARKLIKEVKSTTTNTITYDYTDYDTKVKEFLNYSMIEDDLKLFIKVPFSNTSTITILEGNYLGYNDRIFDYELNIDEAQEIEYLKTWVIKQNHWVTNYEEDEYHPDVEERNFKPITFLQLLSRNTKKSYPFADRLIEYLLGNVITEYDRLGDNIARVQKVMELNGYYTDSKGLWDPKIRPVMYDYINDHKQTQVLSINHDIFGYVDKDVEKYYSGYKWTTTRNKKETISNIDIYPEMYKGSK